MSWTTKSRMISIYMTTCIGLYLVPARCYKCSNATSVFNDFQRTHGLLIHIERSNCTPSDFERIYITSSDFERATITSSDFQNNKGTPRDSEMAVNVTCPAGTFIGKQDVSDVYGYALTVRQFLGIPYARQPTGKLRFKKPARKQPFKQPYDATVHRASCLDLRVLYTGEFTGLYGEVRSEDCLYLNIFVPTDVELNEHLSVIIFIHETNANVPTIGQIMSNFGRVIFVQVNFRLNIWGFLNTLDGVIPGNIGLWDQHVAIQWVHENIEAFGGDPEDVTLLGHFEGASHVVYQALFPSNAGLFNRIIVSCGGVHCPWVFNTGPLQTTNMIARAMGCQYNESQGLLRCLNSKTTAEIVEGVYKYRECIKYPYETLVSTDGAFLRLPPYQILNPENGLERHEIRALSKYDILTSVHQKDGLMLVKILLHDTDSLMVLKNDSLSVDGASMELNDDIHVTYDDTMVTDGTMVYDYEDGNDTFTLTNNDSIFNDPVWDISRLMFGLNFDVKSRKRIIESADPKKCKGSIGCFVISHSSGGPIMYEERYCATYNNGTPMGEEEYAKYGVELTQPPIPEVKDIQDFTDIFISDTTFKSNGWTFSERVSGDVHFENLKAAAGLWTSFAKSGALSSVVALGANIICNKIPGLAPRQRAICRSRPVAIAVIGGGARLGLNECQYQFRNMRWNCTMASKYDSMFGYQHDIASKEAAVWSAISSSGVVYAITQACSLGTLSECGCDKSKMNFIRDNKYDFMWGGCSADIKYGLKLARKFLDAREIEETARSLMNRHNNKVGRKAVRDNMKLECRCHGPTGSCSVKTCWRRLPSFREVGEYLLKQYNKSKHVVPYRGSRLLRPNALVLKKSNRPNKKPRKRNLVYLEKSPNFCEYNLTTGSLGTIGRRCNKGSKGNDGCTLMCCGRGYNTHQYTRTWQCNCTFHWCCEVNCKNCTEKRLEYTCK